VLALFQHDVGGDLGPSRGLGGLGVAGNEFLLLFDVVEFALLELFLLGLEELLVLLPRFLLAPHLLLVFLLLHWEGGTALVLRSRWILFSSSSILRRASGSGWSVACE
jgi:hypothetical protein